MNAPERLFHAIPLHYLPHLLRDGALYAQSVLAAQGIAPRATARRRDRMLGLSDYVHLSLVAQTPLLADKLQRGYPHALLVFPASEVFALPEIAVLPYNAKSWRSRAALTPMIDPREREALLRRHAVTGRFPSLEVLVKYGLSLSLLEKVAFYTAAEHQDTAKTLSSLAIFVSAPCEVASTLFPPCPGYRPVTGEAVAAYFAACRTAGRLLPPPAIPFD
jgi:hypothetical protein